MRVLVLLVVALLQCTPVRACEDGPGCTIPPVGTLATGAVVGGSWDTVYLPQWLYSQPAIDDLWHGLECDRCDWDEGWGYYDVGNLNFTLARLLNAAYVVKMVDAYARIPGFGLWRGVGGIPAAGYAQGQWWGFVAGHGGDEWVPGCRTANGEHYWGLDEYNILHLGGAYFSAVVPRASTLVHETVHQDEDHVDADDCTPSNVSCDRVYGAYNSNTLQINFLHDALVSYQTTIVAGRTVRRVAVTGDTCRWIPLFSDDERTQATTRADSNMGRFARAAWAGWQTALRTQVSDRQAEGSWACTHCDPARWTFAPSDCGTRACNELLNSSNVTVNADNRAACGVYNARIGVDGSSRATVADAATTLSISTRRCESPRASAARTYCDNHKAAATAVRDIDPCGWLEPVADPLVSKLECVQEFCAAKWGVSPWSPGEDPYGCLDYLCGEDNACGSSLGLAECEAEFFMAHADPAYYVAVCEWDECKSPEIKCLLDQHAKGLWSYGDAIPSECNDTRARCEALARLSAMVFASIDRIVDPIGPDPAETGDHRKARNPGRAVREYARAYREAWASNQYSDEQLAQMARQFTRSPEMIAALYHASPEDFVGLFGNEGFLEVLGPGAAKVQGQTLVPDRLTAEGQAAMASLVALRQTLPAEGVAGAIGTFRP